MGDSSINDSIIEASLYDEDGGSLFDVSLISDSFDGDSFDGDSFDEDCQCGDCSDCAMTEAEVVALIKSDANRFYEIPTRFFKDESFVLKIAECVTVPEHFSYLLKYNNDEMMYKLAILNDAMRIEDVEDPSDELKDYAEKVAKDKIAYAMLVPKK